jgi:hypothetical protein
MACDVASIMFWALAAGAVRGDGGDRPDLPATSSATVGPSFKFSVGATVRPDLLEIEGLFTQGS